MATDDIVREYPSDTPEDVSEGYSSSSTQMQMESGSQLLVSQTSDKYIIKMLLREMCERIASLERKKWGIETAADNLVQKYQRESEELRALTEQKRDIELRNMMLQLSEADLLAMLTQRNTREISFLTDEIERYTKRRSDLSTKLYEQTQLQRAVEQQQEAANKSLWLEEELTQKSKDTVQMKAEKESLKERLEDCLSELKKIKDELSRREERHRQEVARHEKLAVYYKDSAEQSEFRVSYKVRTLCP